MDTLAANISHINGKIAEAVERSKYKQKVKLIAVTKTHSVDTLNQAYNFGLKVFGENRVQELLHKIPELHSDIEWHLIGALQTNKVKSVINHVKLIHSLDRVALADEIEKRAEKENITVDTLLEVNVALEASKHGLLPAEVSDFLHYISDKKFLKVKGLMTVAPYTENPEEVRGVFGELRNMFIKYKNQKLTNVDMQWLSMGMTNDFEIAIEEGANMVRIGSGLFGMRH